MSNQHQIKELITRWAAAVRDRDTEAVVANHASDLVMYDVPMPFQSIGLEAYRKTWDLFFECTKPGVFDIVELQIVADEAVGFSFAKMQCANKSQSGDYMLLDFRLTMGIKKIEGQWIILHEHHSVPAEP